MAKDTLTAGQLDEVLAQVERDLPRLRVVKEPEAPARCTGACCRKFTLPEAPEYFERMYLAWKNAPESSFKLPGNDIHIIWPMLIYLGQSDVSPNGGKLAFPQHFYTCKHLDKDTGDCTIYEHRPRMCSEYPYGSRCKYEDCTMRVDAPLTKREWSMDKLYAASPGVKVSQKPALVSFGGDVVEDEDPEVA